MEEPIELIFDLYTDGGTTQSKEPPKVGPFQGISVVKSSSTAALEPGIAGSAAIVLGPNNQKQKLVAFLGDASDAEAELWAGIIGFQYIKDFIKEGKATVNWFCDNKVILDTATNQLTIWENNNWITKANEPVKNLRLWQVYLELTKNIHVIPSYVPAHKGHKLNEACDRACRWMIKSGEKLLGTAGPGLIGRNKNIAPQNAWRLFDDRSKIAALRG